MKNQLRHRSIRLLVAGIVLLTAFAGNGMHRSSADTGSLTPFDLRDRPIYLIASYYNAIALHDYARAYSYWNGQPPDGASLAQFAQGFATLASVNALARLPVIQDGAAGTIHAEVPVVVLTTLTNGVAQTFAGCFHVIRVNVPVGNATEPDPNWHLFSATLAPATSVDFVQATSACSFAESFPTPGGYTDRLSPLDLITSFYDAVAAGDYVRAYSYWPGGAPNQTLTQFAQGFAGTSEVGAVVALSFSMGVAAGSTYASTPLLLTAKSYGTPQLFVGCIVARQSNVPVGNATEPDPNWSLYSAQFQPVTTLDEGIQQVWTACPY